VIKLHSQTNTAYRVTRYRIIREELCADRSDRERARARQPTPWKSTVSGLPEKKSLSPLRESRPCPLSVYRFQLRRISRESAIGAEWRQREREREREGAGFTYARCVPAKPCHFLLRDR